MLHSRCDTEFYEEDDALSPVHEIAELNDSAGYDDGVNPDEYQRNCTPWH
jgi:hypothetical protein